MSGADVGYGALRRWRGRGRGPRRYTLAVPCPVLTSRMVKVAPSTDIAHCAICLCACDVVSGTDVAYVAEGGRSKGRRGRIISLSPTQSLSDARY
eukprot:226580-Rhodomonas_salina.2